MRCVTRASDGAGASVKDNAQQLLWRGPAFGLPDVLVALAVAALAWALAAFYLTAPQAASRCSTRKSTVRP
jgi:hypothetical protein